jgi:3-oxoacyl-[acyl-carrier protein] reductase
VLIDKVAVVTGAAAGIGAEVAVLYASSGADVVLVDRDPAGLADVEKRILAEGGRAERVVLDLADEAATASAMADAEQRHGRVDILAHVAGITRRTDLTEITLDEFDTMYAVNLRSTFQLIQLVSPGMRARAYGKIITTSSISAVRGQGANAHYSAMKAGVVGLTKSAAKALGPFQVTVNAVCPVAVTALTRDYPDLAANRALPPRSLDRAGGPEDVAPTYLYLASPLSDYVTGVVVHADGGYHLGRPE